MSKSRSPNENTGSKVKITTDKQPVDPFMLHANKLNDLPSLKNLKLIDNNDLSLFLSASNDHKTMLMTQWQNNKKLTQAGSESLLNTMDLYALSGNNISMMEVFSEVGIIQTRDLIGLNKDSLADLMRKNKVTAPDEADINTYAEDILAEAEAEQPSAFFMYRIMEKPSWLGLAESKRPVPSKNFKDFYEKNKTFDLKNEPIISLETGELNKNIKDISKITPELIKELSHAQQSLLLSNDSNMAALLFKHEINIKKAVNMTQQALMRELEIDAPTAIEIKQKAQGHHEEVMNGYFAYRDIISNPYIKNTLQTLNPVKEAIIKGIGKDWNKVKEQNGLKDIDNIEDLFGSQNYCECESCKSVLSPAAYFVDLMRFTEKRVLMQKSGNTEVKILDDTHPIHLKVRRPDLWTLKLTCENTNKRIPYVEIVNEVISSFIQKHLGTSKTIAERLIQEQPDLEFTLPYNQPLDEVRIWLSYFSLNRLEVLEYLYPNPTIDEKRMLAIEMLNLSKEQYEIIINQNLNVQVDKDVLKFRRNSGSNPEETEQLTKMKFWDNNLSIIQKKDPTDIQKFNIEFSSTITNWQGKLHRLFRLWKLSKWTIAELDLILSANSINHNSLNAAAILNLAAFKKIQKLLNADVAVLIGILKGLNETHTDNLSIAWSQLLPSDWKTNEEAFLDDLLENSDDDAFNLLLRLQGAFGVNSDDMLACLSLLKTKLQNTVMLNRIKITFSTTTLNQIYRYVHLYKWSGAPSFANFVNLIEVWGNGAVKYFDSPNDDIPEFIKFLKGFHQNNISSEDLIYLFGKESISTEVIDADKVSLNTSEIKDMVASDAFKNGDKFLLLFNKWTSIDSNVLSYYKNFIETSNAALNALFIDLATPATTTDVTYIKLSNIKKRLERLEFLISKYKINIDTLKHIATEAIDCIYTKLGFVTWKTTEWVKELSYLASWIDETKNLRNFNLWLTLRHIEKENNLPLATQKAIAKWKQIDLAQVSLIIRKTSSINETKKVLDRIDWGKKLNLSGALIDRLKTDNSIADLIIQSQTLQNAIRSKFNDNETWETQIQDFKNKLSSNKRDALCSFVIFNQALRLKNFGFDDKEDLYRYFLLDVAMGDCFTLPRIVAATNSLQVYIDRCIMGFEQSQDETISVLLDLDEKEEWEWRKNYRVWEANRKIFLYPENYIEPEIRDNKSPEFKELEDELLQQKLNMEVVENAYKKYLQQIMSLAELKIAGAYHDVEKNRIYLFGKTNRQPVEYYYRNVEFLKNGGAIWSNWEKMNVAIPTEDVSALRYNGKLYVFWTTFQRNDISEVMSGNQNIKKHTYDVYVNYSYLQVDKKWSAPQRVELDYRKSSPFDPFLRIKKYKSEVVFKAPNTVELTKEAPEIRENVLKEFERTVFRKPYPVKTEDRNILQLDYIWTDKLDALQPFYKYTKAIIDAFTVKVKIKLRIPYYATHIDIVTEIECSFDRVDEIVNVATSANQSEAPANFSIPNKKITLYLGLDNIEFFLEYKKNNSEYSLKTGDTSANKFIFFKNNNTEISKGSVELQDKIEYKQVSKIDYASSYIKLADQKQVDSSTAEMQYSLKNEYNTYFDGFSDFYVTDGSTAYANGTNDYKVQQRDMVAILTTPSFPNSNNGHKLNPEHIQMLWDKVSLSIDDLLDHNTQWNVSTQIDYSKSFGNYFYELFFHIPMRIADHLNAAGKYREANHWYNYVYNPTAIKDKFEQLAFPNDVNWRFDAFRNIGIKKLKDIYSDPNAIEMYQRNPGNPHAIARLRIGAYQKNVVMKYLDNLMDWGDYLFQQYTPESTSEARHLYNIVKTILGDKPESTGKCKETRDLSYSEIDINKNSEFIYNLFTVSLKQTKEHQRWPKEHIKKKISHSVHEKISRRLSNLKSSLKSAEKAEAFAAKEEYKNNGIYEISKHIKDAIKADKHNGRPKDPKVYFDIDVDLIFCFPVNKDFMQYWDRVNDRIYKLNNCLDINGVKKLMPSYAPEIDPALLARMVAGGMSFDEIVAALNAQLPNQRFTFLIEKAKQFCNTVQSFGGALFAAMEKRDGEELTLLRATHEQNILLLTTKNKKRQIEQAKANFAGLLENKANIEKRLVHYENLIDEGLIPWESVEQVAKWTSGTIRTAEGVLQILSGVFGLVPQLGSPFAMKYGGVELSGSSEKFGNALEATAKIADNVAMLAGLEGSHQRREQDWTFQMKTATQELKAMAEQLKASEITMAMAEYDLDLHTTNIEQYKELYDFYTQKFSNLQHYTFQIQQLQKLYRMAFNLANDFALKAQQAFEFERFGTTYNTNFINTDNWNADKLGLLAGERLMLQLHQLEKEYIDTDKRKIEITQHFSMLQLAPDKLLELKTTGECVDFKIPEAAFDLIYPGYFRRIIKSVRVTIPCIVGPYTNIGATLTLGNNKIRKEVNSALAVYDFKGCAMIATSNAQNDGGQFELNFRDERYLPFEGAGAIGSWTLSLPKAKQAFDYNSISDVVFHVSYTADYDGVFKGTVESTLIAELNKIHGTGIIRAFSLRHDFPNEWHILSMATNNADILLDLKKEHFPYFTNIDDITSVEAKSFILGASNKLEANVGNEGIVKTTTKMQLKVPKGAGKKGYKDLIFFVKYLAK